MPRPASRVMLRLMLLVCLVAAVSSYELKPYKVGDRIPLECLSEGASPKDGWKELFVCEDDNKPLQLQYGHDGFVSCTWGVTSDSQYQFLRELVMREQSLRCRVPMTADRTLHVPVEIALWGVAEPAHIHVNNHLQFNFHVHKGRIYGAAIYPMRDKFMEITPNSQLALHGGVMFFDGASFRGLSTGTTHTRANAASHARGCGGAGWTKVLTVAVICVCCTFVACLLLYSKILLPRIRKRYLKGD